jgi:MFS family permease
MEEKRHFENVANDTAIIVAQDGQVPKQQPKKGIMTALRNCFTLQPNVSVQHCITYFIAVMFTITAFVFVNHTQPMIIELRMGKISDSGTIHGSLVQADEILALILLPIWGFLSDFLGRRVIYASGFIIFCISSLLYPFAKTPYPVNFPTFFSSLLFVRLLFAVGSSIVGSLMAAFLSDTSAPSNNGRFAGILGFFCGIGALIGVFVLPRIGKWFSRGSILYTDLDSVYLGYYIMAFIQFIVAVLVLLYISPGPTNSTQKSKVNDSDAVDFEKGSEDIAKPKDSETVSHIEDPTKAICSHNTCDNDDENTNDAFSTKPRSYFSKYPTHPCRSRTQQMKRNIVLSFMALKNPIISLAYLSGFVARTATMIYHGYYALWIGPHNAKLIVSLQGTLDLFTLIASPFYGFFANSVSDVVSITTASLFCISAHGIMLFFRDPHSKIQYLVAVLAGIGQAGLTISGLALVSHYAPKRIRGAVSSAYGFCGGLGILINSKLAGNLFDTWTKLAPFIILMSWAALLSILTVGVSIAGRVRRLANYRE